MAGSLWTVGELIEALRQYDDASAIVLVAHGGTEAPLRRVSIRDRRRLVVLDASAAAQKRNLADQSAAAV